MKMFHVKSMMVGIFIFLLPLVVLGQMFLLQDLPTDKTKLGFHYLRPDFKGEDDLSLFSGIYNFSISIPVGSKINVVGAIPYSTLGGEWIDTEGSIGDIYLGLQKRFKSGPDNYSFGSLGVFLPTMAEEHGGPALLGLYSDYYHFFKFLPNVLTVYGNLAYHHIKEKDFIFGGEIGPNLVIPTKGEEEDVELYIHYALTAGYRLNYVDLRVELRGIGIITEDAEEFSDRFLHDIAFGIQVNRGKIRPGAFYKIYLKESIREVISGVIGLKVDFIL